MKNIFVKKKKKKDENTSPRDKVLLNKATIKSQLNDLLNLDQKFFALYLVSRDPIEGKIPKDEIDEIIQNSIACGKDEAIKLLDKYKDLKISDITDNLNIKVNYLDKPNALDYIYFGIFESPNEITIYEKNIKKAFDLLKDIDIDYFDNINFNDIVLAHEIFHYIEFHNHNLYTNTREIDLWSLGNIYTHSSSLICTGEIAGMSFAKNLLNLNFDPTILDYIFLVAYDFDQADKLFKNIIKKDKKN